jgi:hypothetical protein
MKTMFNRCNNNFFFANLLEKFVWLLFGEIQSGEEVPFKEFPPSDWTINFRCRRFMQDHQRGLNVGKEKTVNLSFRNSTD